MMRRLLSFFLLCLLVLPSLAQENTEAAPSDAPLLAYFNGELWQMENGALVLYTACTPDEKLLGQFIPNQDGSRFVMLTWPKVISQALEIYGSLGDIPYGQNFWLCDTSSNSLNRILVQPNADTDFAGELPTAEFIQGRPSWSPDGTKLAWTSLHFGDMRQSLVIFDTAVGASSEIPLDLPIPPFPAPPEVNWTEAGIMLSVTTLDEATFANVESLHVFDPVTNTISRTIPVYNGSETTDFIVDRAFVQQEAGLALALRYYEGGWVLLNLETGEQVPMNARLERFSSNVDGLRLAYDLNAQFNYDFEILGGSNPTPLLNYPLQRVALAPDGSRVAYADATLHLYNADGSIEEIGNSDGFADDASASLIWGNNPLRLIPR